MTFDAATRPLRQSAHPVAVFLALQLILAGSPASAQIVRGPNVNITPKRVTLDRTHRNGQVFVYNEGDSPGEFNIGLVDMVMLPNGQIIPKSDALAKPDQKPYADALRSAKEIVVVSPRHVTLAPHQGQNIRLRLGEMPAGATELRTHLLITTIPDASAGTTAEQAASQTLPSGLKIQVNAVYGMSLPVVVRGVSSDPHAAIENVSVGEVSLRPTPSAAPVLTPVVTFDLVRAGDSSLFGDIAVRLTGQAATEAPAGIALSIGVYPEIPRRHVVIPLARKPSPGERVLITFTDQEAAPGKVLATAAP